MISQMLLITILHYLSSFQAKELREGLWLLLCHSFLERKNCWSMNFFQNKLFKSVCDEQKSKQHRLQEGGGYHCNSDISIINISWGVAWSYSQCSSNFLLSWTFRLQSCFKDTFLFLIPHCYLLLLWKQQRHPKVICKLCLVFIWHSKSMDKHTF